MSTSGFDTVAVGIWLYDGTVEKEIRLLSRPVEQAYSRWFEDERTGEFCLNPNAPMPATPDGRVYYIGASGGGEFPTKEEALAWADRQPWGPVRWTFLVDAAPGKKG